MEEVRKHSGNRVYWTVYNIRTRLGRFIKDKAKKSPIWTVLVFVLLLVLLVLNRSGIQPGVLAIRKYALLVIIGLSISFWYFSGWKKRSNKGNVFSSVILILFVAFSYLAGPSVYKYLSLYYHYTSIDKIPLTSLPETGHERIQPLNSVSTLINQEALSETEDATPPKFIRGKDNTYYYSCAVGPSKSYKLQQLQKNMYEIIHVPSNLPAPVFSAKYRKEVNFDIGELLLFSKRSASAVTKRFNAWQYINCETAEPLYLQEKNGTWVQVVPIIKWKGFLFPRPVFGGVYVVREKSDADTYVKRVVLGKGEFVSPARVAAYEFLKGQNLIPKRVARFTAESFRFANGFFAPMPFYHEGDIRIPELPGDANPQPFITYFKVDKDAKLYNFFGLEPYEASKKGLSLSLLIPGDTDDKVYFIDHRNAKSAIIGSSAIAAKIIESKKNYDWSKNYPAESRPFVRIVNGKPRFMWLSTIVTKAGDDGEYIGGSIPELTLTDATHGKVTWLSQDSLIQYDSWIRQAEFQMNEYWKRE
ncbi:MAG: hypothetical protein ACI9JN_001112 [Bacteroidia bacterium]|jgi:hypothetical protein